MTTRDMERCMYKHLKKMGTYMCYEVQMPRIYGKSKERVDLLQYVKHSNTWGFYELKLTKSDFYSNCKHTFYGNLNYYVMPTKLFDQVKKDIPSHVGVWGIYETKKDKFVCTCIKKPKRQELGVDKDKLLFALMQGLYREYSKGW